MLKEPTAQGIKYVDFAPDVVLGGPGLRQWYSTIAIYVPRIDTYHIRLAVIKPALSAVSHI